MADNPRIEELRRRVEQDPASIAFAQLAEEYRRAGSYQDAVSTCRAGLAIHPSYLSARVTLGRSLIELNSLDDACTELHLVLQNAPENLSAIRGLAEIHHRRGELDQALSYYQSALTIARHDPDLEQTVDEISRALKPPKPHVSDGLTFEQASAEFTEFLDSFAKPPAAAEVQFATALEPSPEHEHAASSTNDAFAAAAPVLEPELVAAGNPTLSELERFLDAIQTYRQSRAV